MSGTKKDSMFSRNRIQRLWRNANTWTLSACELSYNADRVEIFLNLAKADLVHTQTQPPKWRVVSRFRKRIEQTAMVDHSAKCNSSARSLNCFQMILQRSQSCPDSAAECLPKHWWSPDVPVLSAQQKSRFIFTRQSSATSFVECECCPEYVPGIGLGSFALPKLMAVVPMTTIADFVGFYSTANRLGVLLHYTPGQK